MEDQELIKLAFEAHSHSYSPYSHFKVGACVLCSDGHYFLGANIENASFGATNCAERSAIFAAYSNGYRKDDIVKMAVVTSADTLTPPCGICRQVLSELVNPHMPIILANKNEQKQTDIAELMPFSFGAEDMK